MTPHPFESVRRCTAALALSALAVLALGLLAPPARAHAGHDHGPAPAAAVATAAPRLESTTELFELVARLGDGGLTLWLNRFATSEPVAGARIELDSDGIQALAAFDAAEGSYRVTEGPLLQRLRQPGTHALVLTVTAGEQADLMEGSLVVPDPDAGHAHPEGLDAVPAWAWALGGAGLSAVLFGGAALWRRRGAVAAPVLASGGAA